MCLLHLVVRAAMRDSGVAPAPEPAAPQQFKSSAPTDAPAHQGAVKPPPGTTKEGRPIEFNASEFVSPHAFPWRYFRACRACCSPDSRRSDILQLCFDLSFSLVLVGFVFLGLCLAGQFPASVEVMKYVGTYVQTVTKYSLYAFTGIAGCVACALAAWALIKDRSLKPAFYAFLFALLSVLACLGLSIFMLTKSAQLGMEWWMYIISGLMIVQRLLFCVAAIMAAYSLNEAVHDEGIRAHMAAGNYRHLQLPRANQPAHSADVEKGAVPPAA